MGEVSRAARQVLSGADGIGHNTGAMLLRLADGALRPSRRRIVALLPVYNGGDVVAAGIRSLLAQTVPIDEIVVLPNGCTDDTAAVAARFPVTVWDLPRDPHKKAAALNKGWHRYCRDADFVVCIDDDTVLPERAVENWLRELEADRRIGGSSSQPVMTGWGLLPRIQRAEFAESATLSLRRGWCRVVSGTGCMFRGAALREAALIPGQDGPWTYKSVVEDYHLTFQLRKMGWLCVMSPSVYCLTGSMKTIPALWHQRIKWQSGTIGDLLNFGLNRLNWREWAQQFYGLVCILFWVLWLSLNGAYLAAFGHLQVSASWLIFPLCFAAVEGIHAWRIHGRDWKDMLLAVTLVKSLVYSWLTMGWVIWSWWVILSVSKADLWHAQYRADGTDREGDELVGSDGSFAQEAILG